MTINKFIYLISLFIFMIVSITLSAQSPKPCGKQVIMPDAQKIAESVMMQNLNRTLAVDRLVKVYFHICSNDDGTNTAATDAQIQAEFNQLVADYAPNQLCFANMGTSYINSTQMNTMINPDIPSSYGVYALFLVPNCINIFYQVSLANGDGGNAYAIPNTFCSVTTGNIGFQRTLTHEIGHCLGLSHTFAANGGTENINGSNCNTAGDRVCDTPADPWSFNGNPPNACFDTTTNQCIYLGNCMDPNGATNYTPPFNNIMSYWEQTGQPGGCQRTQFTAGQFVRANGFLSTNTPLINTQSPANVLYGPVTAINGLILNAAIFDFTTTGNVILGDGLTAMLQGRKITLNPGFRASPSTGKIQIKPTTCTY